jgi:hypothetical protein
LHLLHIGLLNICSKPCIIFTHGLQLYRKCINFIKQLQVIVLFIVEVFLQSTDYSLIVDFLLLKLVLKNERVFMLLLLHAAQFIGLGYLQLLDLFM